MWQTKRFVMSKMRKIVLLSYKIISLRHMHIYAYAEEIILYYFILIVYCICISLSKFIALRLYIQRMSLTIVYIYKRNAG